MLGGFETVTLSDREAHRRRASQRDGRKVRRQRVRNAVFDCVVELDPPDPRVPGEWRVFHDVNAAVDAIVDHATCHAQARFYDADQKLQVEPRTVDPPF